MREASECLHQWEYVIKEEDPNAGISVYRGYKVCNLCFLEDHGNYKMRSSYQIIHSF